MRRSWMWRGCWVCDACLAGEANRPIGAVDRPVWKQYLLAAAEQLGESFLQSPETLTGGQPVPSEMILRFQRFMKAHDAWKRSL